MYEELLVVSVEHLGFLYYNFEFTMSQHTLIYRRKRGGLERMGFPCTKLTHIPLRLYTYVMCLKLLELILLRLVKIRQ